MRRVKVRMVRWWRHSRIGTLRTRTFLWDRHPTESCSPSGLRRSRVSRGWRGHCHSQREFRGISAGKVRNFISLIGIGVDDDDVRILGRSGKTTTLGNSRNIVFRVCYGNRIDLGSGTGGPAQPWGKPLSTTCNKYGCFISCGSLETNHAKGEGKNKSNELSNSQV